MAPPLPQVQPAPGQALALVNGRVFTAAAGGARWATAVLAVGGRVAAVGSDGDVLAAAPAGALVVDLGGRAALPGIHDAHTHLLFSGLKFTREARLGVGAGPKQIVADLGACTCCNLPGGWLVGGELNPYNFGPGELDRAFLDAAFPDRPIFLYDYSIHHGLANSAALKAAGVDADTPDPPGGTLVRRPGGTDPTGELVERATWPVQRAIPERPMEEYVDAVRWAAGMCARFGITSVQEASAGPQVLAALRHLDVAGELPLRVAAHLVWKEEGFGMASGAELDALLDRAGELATPHVDTRFVKIWLDGAPLPPHFTQADLKEDGSPDLSRIVVDPAELLPALRRFDASGRTVKIHCAGEGAVRVALDALEAVRAGNPLGPPHEVAHAGFVHPSDVPRFAAKGVVAEMSPALWHRREPEFEGLDAGFRFRTMEDAGARVTIGSDWIITPDPNLFPALQGVLERGGESLALERALEIMTIGGARAVRRDKDAGSLEVGKLADVIVLDRDIFAVPSSQVGATRVLLTVFEGRPVFQQGE
ncbi:putative hydrolase [Hyaloraphidium curvatum]|nr:putative hydrolase [Hyaloraphidium curvatum]